MNARRGFFDCERFPFTAMLERNAPGILAELREVLKEDAFVPWPEPHLYGKGWDVFGFYLFGRKIPEHCRACPRTAKVVEEVPGMTTAGFSRLAPGAHIRPHTGFTSRVLRCHLGLITPAGCRLRVGEEVWPWEAGKCLVFDDTLEHEAWNEADTERVVLLLDFRKAPWMRSGAAPAEC